MLIPTYADYVASLSRVTVHLDPTLDTPSHRRSKKRRSRWPLQTIDLGTLGAWIEANPDSVPVLGLVVGLSREKLRNALRQHLGSVSWSVLARDNPAGIAAMLDAEFSLVASLDSQRARSFTFGELLVARAGTRVNATAGAAAGRLVEDRLEAIVASLGRPYVTRSRFVGRNQRTAPCDLACPERAVSRRSLSLPRNSIPRARS